MKLEIKDNQYLPNGFCPAMGRGFKTYFYIYDPETKLYWHHKDQKWRKRHLKEITTFYFLSKEAAQKEVDRLEYLNGFEYIGETIYRRSEILNEQGEHRLFKRADRPGKYDHPGTGMTFWGLGVKNKLTINHLLALKVGERYQKYIRTR